MLWGQLAIKAAVSGVLVAAASEIARRYPGWGGLVASLPLVSFLTILWLWRDTGDRVQIADLAISSSAYVVASLPAFIVIAMMLRRGVAIHLGVIAFVTVGFAGYLAMLWAGRRIGLPV
jgi:hypothetical protein